MSLVVASACSDEYVVQRNAEDPPFKIQGDFSSNVSQFRAGGSKVSAVVTISNETDETQEFSTMWLWIRTPGYEPVRAWHDSISSNPIDEAPIEVGAGTSTEMPVYWVLPTDDASDINVEQLMMKFIRK